MQIIQFHDNAAVARSGKWQIRLLSQTSFALAPGLRAVIIVEPWKVCNYDYLPNNSDYILVIMNLFHNSELQSKKIAKLLTMIMQDIMRYKPGIRRKVRIVRVVDKKKELW